MKEKEQNWFHLQDVLSAIQTYLEQEAKGQEPMSGSYPPVEDTFTAADAVIGEEPPYRKNLPLLQFYFARSGDVDGKALESLDKDYFIPC